MARQPAIGVTLLGLLVLLAGFLTWDSIIGAAELPIGGHLIRGFEFTLLVNAWNRFISPGGATLPNWLVVVAALQFAAFAWMRHRRFWTAPHAVHLGLAIYGVGHAGYVVLVLAGKDEASVGIGSLLTLAAVMGLLVSAVKQRPPVEAG